ncbi:lysozyme [Paludibacter sp.]|uniref:lysozyme n=1 Tax=Paludibacter sp. TaxID=1898105 RepID=UPI0013553648|nr:lysozyme [Paludibacter sp.]MTK53601.1 lysozyme [Paludibacter sp.]
MAKITTVSDQCLELIEQFECGGNVTKYLTAYKCPAGVWTIGIGTTVYPNGQKVKPGDVATKEQAYEYLQHDLKTTEVSVDSFTTDNINQHQFDALVSFAYNVGTGALKGSTLLKKVNVNPADPTIRGEFNKWVNGGGKVLPGLVKRRAAEADLYFS